MEYSSHPIALEAMQGAHAGALAVFVWAIVRLVRPQLQLHRGRGIAIVIATVFLVLLLPIPQFVVLLLIGGLGAVLLRADS